MDLFDHQLIPVRLTGERQSQIAFWPNWLDNDRADSLLSQAINHIDWRSDVIRIAGKTIPIPRLQQWFGAPKTSYTYSNIRLQAVAFPDWIEQLREQVEVQSGERFNRALVNYYRDGSDSVDWHADDEAELGFEPLVASLSLGAERVFQLRHNLTQERLDISLPHGSLLLMGPGIQTYWQHRIAKTKKVDQPRVNFTFRYMAQ
ncbi:alpha-ketoglutarate-dependent dioxygenase AlkB [SAR92 clade bacterium H455]|uniref:Alpha-ketoglutarate-dependent dioxygenase AlkB n=1 Tax=SAR92 clade bacterium H455 TaxID=2974818 RepID=A0ABY5TJT9_9GAMM|nr:alpha-ketoglutarate-dependent dioxygenase AlkB [SAR92 clade bacterium H455]